MACYSGFTCVSQPLFWVPGCPPSCVLGGGRIFQGEERDCQSSVQREDGAVLERRRVASLRQDVRGGAEGRHLAGAPSSFYQPLLLHPGLFCRLHSNEGGGGAVLCNHVM